MSTTSPTRQQQVSGASRYVLITTGVIMVALSIQAFVSSLVQFLQRDKTKRPPLRELMMKLGAVIVIFGAVLVMAIYWTYDEGSFLLYGG
jgi:hypothetical protein